MEPNNIDSENKNEAFSKTPNPSTPSAQPSGATDDLHAEGIDIVGSSVAEDNEFSKPEGSFSSASGSDDSLLASAASDQALKELEADASEAKSAGIPRPPQPQPALRSTPPQMPPQQQFQSAQQQPKTIGANDPSIKPLRTFKSDAEEAVKYGGVSKVDIVVAEQKKREAAGTPIQYESEKHASTGLYIALLGAIIVILGGGWFYWFSSSQTPAQQGKIVAPQVELIGIVPFAKAAIVVLDPASDPMALISAKIKASVPALGTVGAIAPIATADATVMSPISDVIAKTRIPNRLARSLDSPYMVGSYEYDVQSPFLIIKNTFFQNAFSGMLEWERDLATDFISFIQISSPGTTAATAGGATFEDAIVSNVNVRTLKDPAGKTILTYAFADKDTIVLTTTDTALKYLLNQILQVRTIQ